MKAFQVLFGCWHKHYTFPIQLIKNGKRCGEYVCCLDCGKEFSYDWQQMRVGAELIAEEVVA